MDFSAPKGISNNVSSYGASWREDQADVCISAEAHLIGLNGRGLTGRRTLLLWLHTAKTSSRIWRVTEERFSAKGG